MGTTLQDVRFGGRQMLRHRGTSLLAILTLALGIGATTSVFTVVDSTMLRPLPYPDPEQLVSLGLTETMSDGRQAGVGPSMEDLLFLRQATDLFSSVEGFGSAPNGYVTDSPEPERVQAVTFTEGYLAMHGVAPMIGRGFTVDDMTPQAPLVALLGHGYWQSRFGGGDVIGRTIRLDERVATVVGVLPRSFNPNTPVSLPLVLTPEEFGRRGLGSRVNVVARLRDGVTIEAATEQGSARLAGWTPAASPDRPPGPARLRVTSRLDTVTRPQRTTANVLLGAVGLVLLLACVNVAGLLLARGATRHAEVALRASLGASRGRIVRQLLAESLALVLPGAAIGVFVAWLTLDLFVANVPLFVPSNSPAAINTTVLGATLAILVPTVLAIGLWPALRMSRVRLGSALAAGSRQGTTPLSRRGGQALIAVEVALAVVLVAGAGLMIRSFSRLMAVDLGYEPDGLVTMQVLSLERSAAAQADYYAALLDRARSLPGVSGAAVSDYFHMGTGTRASVVAGAGKPESVAVYRVTPGYFETIGVRLVAGQWPAAGEADPARRPVVINESAARLLFPDGPAVGRAVTRGGAAALPHTVVGVAADVLNNGPTGSRTLRPAHVYLPFALTDGDLSSAMTLTVRAADASSRVADGLRQLAHAIGPRALVERIQSGEELLGAGVATPRKRTVMLGLLGALGLLHALVGIVGVTAYAVTRRTREIGVRLAFGARPGQLVGAVIRDSSIPIVIGAAAGVATAAFATRAIQSFLFETSPVEPATLSIVTGGLIVAGVLAAAWPAVRASRVDPVMSLRVE